MKHFNTYLQKLSHLFIPALVALSLTALVFYTQVKHKTYDSLRAATYSSLAGWVWSDNFGWISFDCASGGPTGNNICATSNYQVKTDTNGILQGYAWSDNAGWISFNENTGCPSTPCRPTLTATGLTGWARIISVSYPVDPDPQAGGYDGWIDLSTVGRSGNSLTGWAWGGSLNAGWFSFNCATGGPTGNNICATYPYGPTITTVTIPDPTLVLTLTPSNSASLVYMKPGGNVTLNWTSTNVDTCSASGDWSGTKALSGTEVLGPLNTERLYTYNEVCTNTTYALSASTSRSITVTSAAFCGDYICNGSETTTTCPSDCTTAAPGGDTTQMFKASPITVKPGATTVLKYNIVAGQSCKIYNDNTSTLLTTIPDGNQTGSYTTPAISARTTFSLQCLGGVNVKATVSVFSLFEF